MNNLQIKQINNDFQLPMEVINKILNDKQIRRELTRENHYWFFHLYFSEYVKHPTANFQREMFQLTEDENIKMAVIIAFRGSAKSTIMTMSYPLWAILGKQQKKCVVIISQTQQQVRTHFSNLKRELESNEILRNDLGALEEESDEWGSYSLVLPKFNARIIAASSEQSIRGIRHGANRPDLIICDDVEDISSVKTKEGRDKAFSWLTGEVIPLGDQNTKILMIGNLLHEDSLLMGLKRRIQDENMNAIFREYPIVDSENEILWQSKFKDLDAISNFKKIIGDDKAWQREYMLKIIPDEDQLVFREWIQYYDELPTDRKDYMYTSVAVDLAISQSSTADYTAMVTGHVYGNGDNLKIYILPNPVNLRITFPQTVEKIKSLADNAGLGERAEIFIEDVGYQKSVIQQLKTEGYYVKGFPVNGQDKRARLSSVTPLIELGKVMFPRGACEDLITQLVNFGVEKHDDLVDALTILLHMVIKQNRQPVVIYGREVYDLFRGYSRDYGSDSGGYYSTYWSGGDPRTFKNWI